MLALLGPVKLLRGMEPERFRLLAGLPAACGEEMSFQATSPTWSSHHRDVVGRFPSSIHAGPRPVLLQSRVDAHVAASPAAAGHVLHPGGAGFDL